MVVGAGDQAPRPSRLIGLPIKWRPLFPTTAYTYTITNPDVLTAVAKSSQVRRAFVVLHINITVSQAGYFFVYNGRLFMCLILRWRTYNTAVDFDHWPTAALFPIYIFCHRGCWLALVSLTPPLCFLSPSVPLPGALPTPCLPPLTWVVQSGFPYVAVFLRKEPEWSTGGGDGGGGGGASSTANDGGGIENAEGIIEGVAEGAVQQTYPEVITSLDEVHEVGTLAQVRKNTKAPQKTGRTATWV